jgi:hypothetical protein
MKGIDMDAITDDRTEWEDTICRAAGQLLDGIAQLGAALGEALKLNMRVERAVEEASALTGKLAAIGVDLLLLCENESGKAEAGAPTAHCRAASPQGA